MAKLTRVYTRTGDDGSTGLGSGERVSKSSLRIQAYGAVDELNAQIGVVLAAGIHDRLVEPLSSIQNELFRVGADLCIAGEGDARPAGPRVEARHVASLERFMDEAIAEVGPLENFILPGGTPAAAQLHAARTICRRAEREVVRLAAEEAVGEQVLVYLNRLSDVLFVMSRLENKLAGVSERVWDSRT